MDFVKHFVGDTLVSLTGFLFIQNRRMRIGERLSALQELLPEPAEVCM